MCLPVHLNTGLGSLLWDPELLDLSQLNDVRFTYCQGNNTLDALSIEI